MEKRDEKKGVIQKRVELAKKELQFSKYYDYVVTNRNIKDTLKELEEIVLSPSK